MNRFRGFLMPAVLALCLPVVLPIQAGTLTGNLRDENWYARRSEADPLGVGYYEYAINGNATGLSNATGLAAATGVYGEFANAVPAGSYTIASWDVWWRSAFAFNVVVPAVGTAPPLDLRLRAAIWGYPAFWDDTGYPEFGQTFVASGPITMIYLRLPAFSGSPNYRLTIHDDGPFVVPRHGAHDLLTEGGRLRAGADEHGRAQRLNRCGEIG